MANAPGLLAVTKVTVPADALCAALSHLREAGACGHEGLALWAGIISGPTATVCETIIPRQRAIRTSSGLCVTVDAQELHEINVYLYERQLRLIAQVHSHGEEAYHSEADDRYSVVTALGALSIVVPYFASQPFTLRDCALHQLHAQGWVRLSFSDARGLFEVTE